MIFSKFKQNKKWKTTTFIVEQIIEIENKRGLEQRTYNLPKVDEDQDARPNCFLFILYFMFRFDGILNLLGEDY